MRRYRPKNNVQKKSYYSDRFYVAPTIPREDARSSALYGSQLEKIEAACTINESYIEAGNLILWIGKGDLVPTLRFLKEEMGYETLTEMSAIDYLERDNSFELFYQMLNYAKASRIRVRLKLPRDEQIQSVEPLFRSADWAERECFDMFGIRFVNHPNLKRIMMPDDWSGHPLLKSYPLHGDEAAQWYEVDKIFGKENREAIGPENRDGAMIDRYDTERFARIGHEVEHGVDISRGEDKNDIAYQEEKGAFLIEKINPEKSKQLDKRR